MSSVVAPEFVRLYIDGEWTDALSEQTLVTANPCFGTEITRVAEAQAEDVDLAVTAARRAFDDGPWRSWTASKRAATLLRVADLMEAHANELAELESIDAGKPISETLRVDVPMAAATFRYFAGWCTKISGENSPLSSDYLHYTLREPYGVCALIVAWNFPLLLAARKLAPALATGNTVVLKPASLTPLSALRLAQILDDAGVPRGVVNVIPGHGAQAGEALISHPGVDKISLTGSTETGQAVMRMAAQSITRVSLELGGKSPNIVFDDADLDAAARGVVGGIFFNKGEVCTAGSRLFVQSSIHDELVERIVDRAKSLAGHQGDTLDPDIRLGPQVSRSQLETSLRYVGYGLDEGARLVIGGERTHPLGKDVGWFLHPAVFTEVNSDMRIAREEIFGPVLSVIRFDEVEDALRQSNQSLYGLAAGVWTRDLARAHQAARALQAGTVWVNCYNVFDPAAPFGGYKRSGFGRENGQAAIEDYTQLKSVIVRVG